MKILIVEDDLLIAEMLKRMLGKLGYKVCQICSNYATTIKFLEENSSIDLVFLDINLNDDKNGVDIGAELNSKYSLPFIYLTSYSDPKTIKSASKTLPENYLVKPFNETMLLSALAVIEQKIAVREKSVIIKNGTDKIKILNSEIDFIKAEGNYIEISTKTKRFVVRNSLEHFMTELNDNSFIRTHRSYIVNLRSVLKIKNQVLFVFDNEIPLSRKYRDHVMTAFNQIN